MQQKPIASQNEPLLDGCGSPTVFDGKPHAAYTTVNVPVSTTQTMPYSFQQSQDGSACGVNTEPAQGNSTITSNVEGTKTTTVNTTNGESGKLRREYPLVIIPLLLFSSIVFCGIMFYTVRHWFITGRFFTLPD